MSTFTRPLLLPLVLLHICAIVSLGDELQDVTIYSDYDRHHPTVANFEYNGVQIGPGREAFEKILADLRKRPAGTSVVWGPNFARCGSCSGSEPACLPKQLFPDLWKELEAIVAERKLTLTSAYPGPITEIPGRSNAEFDPPKIGQTQVRWYNFHGLDTPHEEVLYTIDGRFLGRGERGFERLLEELDRLPRGTEVTFPRNQYGGRRMHENLGTDEVKRRNAELIYAVPFASRRADIRRRFRDERLTAVFVERAMRTEKPRTVYDWNAGDEPDFVSFGRLVRHDERPPSLAARIGWIHYDAALRDEGRKPESEAVYTLDDAEQGRGVAGFAKLMDRLGVLPEGSSVGVRVCLRTKGPFTCPITFQGHRHFERTGFEPSIGLFPWLIEVAKTRKLKIYWLPDEARTCGDCELNK